MTRAHRFRKAAVSFFCVHVLAVCAHAAPASAPSRFIENLDAGKTQTLVLYGTSLTASRSNWAAMLTEAITARYGERAKVINAAKGGMESRWGMENLDERVLAHKPDAVTIEFSMNDASKRSALSVAAARKNLEVMIDRLLAVNPRMEIFLMTMNPIGGEPASRPPTHPHYRHRLDDYYAMVREVAVTRGLRLVDHHANWMGAREARPEWFALHVPDGVHPDSEGARKVIFPAMLRALGLPAPEEPRVRTTLATGWRFIKKDVAPDADASAGDWETVALPHTWNAADGMKRGYYRGPGWYALTFSTPAEGAPDGRFFLRFGGASVVSDVYFNGRHLGQHRGAFGAFCHEITALLRRDGRPNELRVRCDNSKFNDIIPISGDFLVSGGLYRAVELLRTGAACISPLDYASPGVRVRQQLDAGRKRAEISVGTLLSNAKAGNNSALVRINILDTDAVAVASAEEAVSFSSADSPPVQNHQTLTLDNPHLWHGVRDPYLYTVRVELVQGGRVVDVVEQPLGVRTLAHDFEKGILLNGEPYPVLGVNRHQDREGKGWAISEADKIQDMRLIKDMGATAIRLAHYPHDSAFYELCDRAGMLVWAELAFVNDARDTDAFRNNVRMQFRELLRQHGNHPSIAWWSLYNEITPRSAAAAEPLVQELHAMAKAEDPQRFTVAAPYRLTPEGPLRSTTDLLAFNGYPGWYDYMPERSLAEWFADWLKSGGARGIGLSEYGAGASVLHHEELPCPRPYHLSPWHPEEYQAQIIETCYRQIAETRGVWGSFVWNMFDFACPSRNEGDRPGNLDKGIVTYDRATPKDAYYFYKANWNAKKMVYITSRRFTERRVPVTTVKVYANTDDVELFVNGRSQGKRRPDKYKIAHWENVPLEMGDNRIEAKASAGKRVLADKCVWRRLPPRASAGIAANAAASLPGNPPENAADGKFNNAWLASCKDGARPQLTLALPGPRELSSVSILWWYGHNRTIDFMLEGSADGVTFEKLAAAKEANPGRPREYMFPKQMLRALRVSGMTTRDDGIFGIIELQCGPGEWPAEWGK